MDTNLQQQIKEVLKKNNIKKVIENKDFHFQKAVNKYNEFIAYDIGEGTLDGIVEDLNKIGEFNFNKLLSYYDDEYEEYKFLKIIGQLISYLDSKAANKHEYNEYEDKRVVSTPFVRQNKWVEHLLNYKKHRNLEQLSDNIANSLRYIIDPENNINIVSPVHQQLISLILFKRNDYIDNFADIVKEEFTQFDIKPVNPNNLTDIYSSILYSSEIRKLWDNDKRIWKVSHGNNGEFNENEKETYLKENIIAVHKDTGRSQGQNFTDKMKVGDYFYLCYGSQKIVALGVVSSDAKPLEDKDDGWMERKYILIKKSISDDRYEGVKKGWTPNYNSTCMEIKDQELNVFQQNILGPYFDLSIKELMEQTIEDLQGDEYEEIQPIIDEFHGQQMKPEGAKENDYEHEDLNIILYGPPGTGKTYNSTYYAVSIIEGRDPVVVKEEPYVNVKAKYKDYMKKGQIAFCTFHQSYGYEEFIEGIKPIIAKEHTNKEELKAKGEIQYKIEDGILKEISEKAKGNYKENYIIIIDEINRGNISKIFGELITLVESSKRIGKEEEIYVTLPYSKEPFGVPSNLYILGTMNTADRSIALMDTALRRRFKFIEIEPETSIFKKMNDNKQLVIEGVDIKKMLDTINKRIEVLYDREHMIGQAYFMELLHNKTIDKLSDVFENKIIPLLQEYFYDDYEKIRLILADNQISIENMQFVIKENIDAALFGDNSEVDLIEDMATYRINTDALTNPMAYIKIYDKILSRNGDMPDEE
ncbi:McrB family protein [Alkaliphilus transvaalensis]|uniref:McrB family protein n=1 Tax=Alkaliphilus transvaalensis TaxID=114628 RepID=UPI0006883203|nr:AAA family ATPase [Alkaliphilus transvaalensis]